MPTYQYQCTACGEGLEVVQKFTDDSLTVCPQCEGALRKVYSAVGIVFKGSGFYRTDSRSSSSSSSSSGSANGSSPSTTSNGSSASSAKSESSSSSSSSSGTAKSTSGSGSAAA